MVIFMSSQKMDQVLRQVNPDSYSPLRLDKMAKSFFTELSSQGLQIVGDKGVQGDYAALHFQITTHNRQALIYAIASLSPECLTVEKADLPVLVPDAVLRAALTHAWMQFAPVLDRITVDELFPTLDQIYTKLIMSAPVEVTDADSAWVRENQEAESRQVFEAAGIDCSDPFEAYEAQRAAAVAAYTASQEKRAAEFYGGGPDTCVHGIAADSCVVCAL